jgi:hypothetical protein
VVERKSRGSLVVKPIWLLMTMCTVPPVLVTARLRHAGEGLLHHALATEGGVAMHQHRQHLGADLVAATVLTSAHAALHHRVDDLQVRGVEGQRSGAPGRQGVDTCPS